ncbi:MAG: uroporphyrinogen-III synthase [Erythrobacter sp.]|uniref:uroporphyrinogen-III synthase n=1 Tax=Erythrobacter sp. TaxID=1042 RepID=UPI002604F449|nr:uroporphyrinogen-III synthase [Erythrobacter sp.]MDJ0978721.1 uroporphyrinogen-III synthase [Erythrobacter sp.]
MSDTPVLAIRPEPGLSATLALGRQMGLAMHGFALSRVVPVEWEVPSLSRFDALLIGSANAMRLGGKNLARLTHLPVHAVGEATAREARAAGFEVTRLGQGGLQSVLDAVEPPVHYLRLVGNEYVALDWPEGVSFEPLPVYAVQPRHFLDKPASLLQGEVIVLLHSAASTRQFVSECARLSVDRSRVTLAAMGERIAEPARAADEGGWAAVHIAMEPSDEALLAMVSALCQ